MNEATVFIVDDDEARRRHQQLQGRALVERDGGLEL